MTRDEVIERIHDELIAHDTYRPVHTHKIYSVLSLLQPGDKLGGGLVVVDQETLDRLNSLEADEEIRRDYFKGTWVNDHTTDKR